MEEKDIELLLADLSARLPYGVIIKHFDTNIDSEGNLVDICILDDITTTIINEGGYEDIAFLIESKPYLRPMSSMTKEEKETYNNLCYEEEREEYELGEWVTRVYYHDTIDSIDYLNSIHVDYRGLIPKGLAIEVTEKNNPYKK